MTGCLGLIPGDLSGSEMSDVFHHCVCDVCVYFVSFYFFVKAVDCEVELCGFWGDLLFVL